ncbi:MAG: phosphate ABC transporter permease subunit PstC [Clostridiales bacterium]|jgi:phosphate transport system permease protein|nr:phosphate ABC transporter permease subunit PstC [Clostridiales bacterium]
MKKFGENFFKFIFFVSAVESLLIIILMCIFLFAGGIPAIKKIGFINFLFGKEWSPSDEPSLFGIFPMILGSVYVTFGAILFGAPLGIFTAIFMSWFCLQRFYSFFKFSVEVLAGIPSIIFGLFGMVFIVPFFEKLFGVNGNNILSASVLLGIMILPTIIKISENSLKAVPKIYYEGALALGSSHERSIFFVIVPAANSGIISSVILGVGRALGETLAVIMVAGNQGRMPKGLLQGVRTLTANIAIEMGYASGLHREALIATGIILFVFVLSINISFSIFKNKTKQ